MIQLFLKHHQDTEYTEVYPDFSQDIKFTRENPYFSSSGSYTLDITIPMSVLPNKIYFDNLQRFEKRKTTESMDVMLVAANHTIMTGTAHITEVHQDQIKIQLLGGKSEVKFMSLTEDKYIDTLTYEKVEISPEQPWDKGTPFRITVLKNLNVLELTGAPYVGLKDKYVFVPVYDEEDDVVLNPISAYFDTQGTYPKGRNYVYCEVVQPNLLFVLKSVIEAFGYHVALNELNTAPYNRVYIAAAAYKDVLQGPFREHETIGNYDIAAMLPHWTVSEFISQVEHFFNVTIQFDDVNRSASILKNTSFFNDALVLDTEDEFSVELIEEEEESDVKTLASSNIEYDMSESPEHFIDNVSPEVEEAYEKLIYRSYGELIAAMNSMGEDEKSVKIFCYGDNEYIYDTENHRNVRINHFGRLVRSQSDDTITLKIVPVAMTKKTLEVSDQRFSGVEHIDVGMISVNQPKSAAENDAVSVWDAINGEDIEKPEKDDRMEVFFVDDNEIETPCRKEDESFTGSSAWGLGGFTDHELHRYSTTQRESWSMALRPGADNNMGINRLHINGYSINSKARYEVKFLASDILPINKIFIFRNRKFVCEKMEYTISKGQLSKSVTGYFYELS